LLQAMLRLVLRHRRDGAGDHRARWMYAVVGCQPECQAAATGRWYWWPLSERWIAPPDRGFDGRSQPDPIGVGDDHGE